MTNNEKFTQSYSDLVDILYNFTGVLSGVKSTNEINEDDLKLLGELSTVLKRMGDTIVLDKIELSPKNDIKKKDTK